MMKAIHSRRLEPSKVIAMCIKCNYYTCGSNDDYYRMLDVCGQYDNIDIDTVVMIASDIYNHSDSKKLLRQYGCNKLEMIEYILYGLLNDCCYYSVTLVE